MNHIIYKQIVKTNTQFSICKRASLALRVFLLFLSCFLLSCSTEDHEDANHGVVGGTIKLSISFNSNNEEVSTRSVGIPNDGSESAIYSLMVFIFNPETGERDGFAYLKAIEAGVESLTETAVI